MKIRSLLLAAAAITACGTLAHAGQRLPLATDADKALAPLEISTDGGTVRFRAAAQDNLRICVMPRTFGPERCTTVGEMRRSAKTTD
jgi:hypothetical protein